VLGKYEPLRKAVDLLEWFALGIAVEHYVLASFWSVRAARRELAGKPDHEHAVFGGSR
jgi:hypothetical protein